jgi:hypothetical protein
LLKTVNEYHGVMGSPEFVDIDPSTLHFPTSRPNGAEPVKLHDQIVRYGTNVTRMPLLLAYRGLGGELMIYGGLTRATRVAKLLPGTTSTGGGDKNSRGVLQPPARNRRQVAMTNSELKQEILRALSELVEQCPEVRFGQLIVNLSYIARGPIPEAIWDMEDDELLAATKTHLEDYDRWNADFVRSSP